MYHENSGQDTASVLLNFLLYFLFHKILVIKCFYFEENVLDISVFYNVKVEEEHHEKMVKP